MGVTDRAGVAMKAGTGTFASADPDRIAGFVAVAAPGTDAAADRIIASVLALS